MTELPKEWKEFSMKRIFRGTTYNIIVKNPKKVSSSVKKVIIDGNEFDFKCGKCVLPLLDNNGEHTIEVFLGN